LEEGPAVLDLARYARAWKRGRDLKEQVE
jgi:hypothetical protein